MTTKNFNYSNVTVKVTDNKGTWEDNKPVTSVIALYNPTANTLDITVPEPRKRDTTKNPALFTGEKTKMEVTVHKDGTYGFSWTPKAGEMRLLTLNQVVKEFKEAMIKYFEAIGK